MKNVKIFICVMLVAFVSILIYSCAKDGTEQKNITQNLQTETRGASFCEDQGGNCNGLPYSLVTIPVIGIPSYPNCPFSITYKVRKCALGLDMIFISFSYQFNDPGCAQFDIDTNGPNATVILDQVIKELINVAIETEAFDIVEPCGQAGPKLINFFQAACSKRCLVEEYTIDRGTIRKIVVVPCGNGCCKTSLTVCIDENDELVTKVVGGPSSAGSCPPQSELPCPQNTIRQGICQPSCLIIATGG